MAETNLKLSDEIKKDGLSEQVVTTKVEKGTGKLLPNGGYPMHTFDDLKAAYSLYIHNEADQKMIEDAYHFAEKKHAGIIRKSGEPYIHHLIEVAYIVATLQGGPVTIAAALLHDVVEDTDTTVEDIEKIFGEETARIVDSLTKIQRLKLSKRTQEEFEAEDHRKIFLGMAKDVRVIIIKLADRLHNLRTIEALKPERQHALAKETLEVFAPIAHRLGIYRVESELEDLSLKIEKPEEYQHISELLNEKIKNRKNALNQLKKKIADILYRQGFKFEIEARVKSIYSIYKKMFLKNHKFEDIYDVLALRIITETELNCYEILGIIHQNFTPIPGRFKDYIAMPKPNMYQSLHTSVIDGNSNIFEVQIRTKEMDEIAESGVAAHWRYKEGTHYSAKQEQKEIEEKLHWFRDFVSISKDKDLSGEDAQDYLDTLSKDIFEANVYVFTPKGKVIDLPAGSTPLDLAFKVHTKVGESAVGAVVNGNLVPLNTPLKTGDVCEIKTSKTSPGPNESWLNIVKTSSAKSRIKKFLLKKNSELVRDEKINRGKTICLDFFKDRGYNEREMVQMLNTQKLLDFYHFDTLDDVYVGIAMHNPTPGAIANVLGLKKKNNDLALSKKENFDDDKCPVTIENGKGIKITLGNCCTPIPGDEIIGYVTKGNGVTVHRKECPNIINEKSRLIDVKWKEKRGEESYPVDLSIECNDRNNLIADILSALAGARIKCTEISAKLHSENFTCTISTQIYVKDINELNKAFQLLKNVKDVYEVKRVIH